MVIANPRNAANREQNMQELERVVKELEEAEKENNALLKNKRQRKYITYYNSATDNRVQLVNTEGVDIDGTPRTSTPC